jgi:hypothetical protein
MAGFGSNYIYVIHENLFGDYKDFKVIHLLTFTATKITVKRVLYVDKTIEKDLRKDDNRLKVIEYVSLQGGNEVKVRYNESYVEKKEVKVRYNESYVEKKEVKDKSVKDKSVKKDPPSVWVTHYEYFIVSCKNISEFGKNEEKLKEYGVRNYISYLISDFFQKSNILERVFFRICQYWEEGQELRQSYMDLISKFESTLDILRDGKSREDFQYTNAYLLEMSYEKEYLAFGLYNRFITGCYVDINSEDMDAPPGEVFYLLAKYLVRDDARDSDMNPPYMFDYATDDKYTEMFPIIPAFFSHNDNASFRLNSSNDRVKCMENLKFAMDTFVQNIADIIMDSTTPSEKFNLTELVKNKYFYNLRTIIFNIIKKKNLVDISFLQ